MWKKVILSFAVVAVGFCQTAQGYEKLEVVPSINLSRYLGTWYQIARKPVIFEAGCVCSRQVLTLNPDNKIGVNNSCNFQRPTGRHLKIEGVASITDSAEPAKLKVDFGLPWKGDYWIIAIDREYRYAVVSDPARRSLYVLSKTPQLSNELYHDAIESVADQVDISKLKLTRQDGCLYSEN